MESSTAISDKKHSDKRRKKFAKLFADSVCHRVVFAEGVFYSGSVILKVKCNSKINGDNNSNGVGNNSDNFRGNIRSQLGFPSGVICSNRNGGEKTSMALAQG